jgi:hypothetical protein
MPHKQAKRSSDSANRASVREEMMLPRTARSAKVAALNLDETRNPEPPSTTVSGTVEKIIPPKGPDKSEKAQITIDKTDHRHRNIRIKNELTDEHGDDVKLKKGAHVEVTVSAEPKNSTATTGDENHPTRHKTSGMDFRRRNA